MNDVVILCVVTYCAVTLILCAASLINLNFLHSSTEKVLDFRKPYLMRISLGMLSLLLLVVAVQMPADQNGGRNGYAMWYTWMPVCLSLAALIAFLAGPQNIYIDVEARAGYTVKGWFFHPRRQKFRLGDKSFLCLITDHDGYTVLLCVADSARQRAFLGKFAAKDAALRVLQEVAEKLDLPIKELTAVEMINQS